MPTNAQTIAHSLERGTISDGRFTLTRTIRPAGATTGEGGMVFAAGELQRHDWSMANTIFEHKIYLRMIRTNPALKESSLVIRQIQVKAPQDEMPKVIGTVISDSDDRLIGYCIEGRNPKGERRIMQACLQRLCTADSIRLFENTR